MNLRVMGDGPVRPGHRLPEQCFGPVEFLGMEKLHRLFVPPLLLIGIGLRGIGCGWGGLYSRRYLDLVRRSLGFRVGRPNPGVGPIVAPALFRCGTSLASLTSLNNLSFHLLTLQDRNAPPPGYQQD